MIKKISNHIANDLPASVVVLLVAIPLCLGIALGSDAPLFSGIIGGIVGGIVIGILSGSHLSVSGPAAGLTVIVAASIAKLPAFEAFLLAVVIAGIIQLILGFINAGVVGDYVPNSVIKGMLAAIGIILILKQFPHLIGYDSDYIGDSGFMQSDNENTFSGIISAFSFITPGAILSGIAALLILIVWERPAIKKLKYSKFMPGPLIAVISGIGINEVLHSSGNKIALQQEHLVQLPVAGSAAEFAGFLSFPDFSLFADPVIWTSAVTLALVASLETLLSIEAIDKIDPLKRVTPTNRELKAQGIGNIVSGMLGGLPLTSVIVRSSANVNAGGTSKLSAIFHGMLLLGCVMFIPEFLNKMPLASLAAILIFTGYKLAKVSLFKEFYKKGFDQFVPFVCTILAILFTDLLTGVLIGLVIGLFFMIRSNFRSSVFVVHDDDRYFFRLRKDVSFLNKPIIKKKLEEIGEDSFVQIDITRADFIDKDIIDTINEFMTHAHLKNIRVEIKKSKIKKIHEYFNEQTLISNTI